MSLDHQIEDIKYLHWKGGQQMGSPFLTESLSKPFLTRWYESWRSMFFNFFFSILTIYRRIVISRKAGNILSKFSEEEFLLIGTELMGPNRDRAGVYSFLVGAFGMGNFFSKTHISPFKSHFSSKKYKEMIFLLKVFQKSLSTEFKNLPLLVNSPSQAEEFKAIYRARLAVGK